MKKFTWVIALAVIFFIVVRPVTADAPTNEDKTINLAQSLTKSIVIVNVSSDKDSGHGTGFYISPYEIITDQHVTNGAKNITVMEKQTQPCADTVYYADPNIDLALLDTECKGTPLTLADSVTVGQTMVMMGNPEDRQFFLTKGIVSDMDNYLGGHFVGFDSLAIAGDSGAPIVNLQGEVLGVVRFAYNVSPKMGLATDDASLKEFIAYVAYLKSKE